ncbi:DNA methyltransferase [Nitrogeniibacter aestuarii]|uniref:DNA methyltransferase n=1 Tax=Nitrogeniibacter aestuarii TaxID=2815343 RepID=UPI001E56B08C|nr:DNA methyltransferase [Nitrogeniibacter aestuarii]
MTSTADKPARLEEFTTWVAAHIKGDEKGEAQIFLDRLFRALGWPGLKEAGAQCEERVKNTTGGTSFADLVWKPVVVIEMKKRGVDLSKHYRQAFDYWTRLVPNRPRYAVLCNFDEFWVYDFETQLDTPVDKVKLSELPAKFGPLNFMFPGDVAPIFGNHQESVTRQAADKLASCFNSLLKRGIDQPLAQRFILQMLMALFAEDIDLLAKYFVTRLLEDCKTPEDSYDILGGLFEAMNTKGGVPGGRYKGVAYFNGGLFASPARIELNAEELELLKDAARFNWSAVRPEIFGTIFEHSLGKEARHASGAHFTSPVDIMKVIGPTIVAPWSERIESAKTLGALKKLLARIENFTVLDPACGSGNFLYTAYRELKRLEARIYERMAAEYKSVDPYQRPFGFVSARNFFGIDINPFAVDIAKVTMMLAHKLSIDELHINEPALPLDNLDGNFRAGDALINADGTKAKWFEADVIVGNPPFLGAKRIKQELDLDYIAAVRRAYPDVPGMADFCVYWFRRAHDELAACTEKDPLAGRAGLVGTQNVRSNQSRVGGLDHVVVDGTIIDAVDNQPWSGEANVHVSIVNWMKTQDPTLVPKKKRLWFQVKPTSGKKAKRPRGAGLESKRYELDLREVPSINSALSDRTDLKGIHRLGCNLSPQRSFQGVTPGHKDFVLPAGKRKALLAKEPKADELLFPYFVGKEVLGGTVSAKRFILDFGQRDILGAQAFPVSIAHVEEKVLPARQQAAEKGKTKTGKMRPHHKAFLDRWWQLSWGRADMVAALKPLSRFIACSRVTTRPIFFFLSSKCRPGDALQVFAFEDDYSFGILQSVVHIEWFLAKRSNMKKDPRYSSTSVFDTFPWPQYPSRSKVEAVAEAACYLRAVREKALEGISGGLRALYRTLELPGKNELKDAHAALDIAVLAAYGFDGKKDILHQLRDLNEEVAAAIEEGKEVCGPGISPSYPAPKKLVSSDCFGA